MSQCKVYFSNLPIISLNALNLNNNRLSAVENGVHRFVTTSEKLNTDLIDIVYTRILHAQLNTQREAVQIRQATEGLLCEATPFCFIAGQSDRLRSYIESR